MSIGTPAKFGRRLLSDRWSLFIPAARAAVLIASITALVPSISYAQGPLTSTVPFSLVIDSPCILGEVVVLEGRLTTAIYARQNGGFTFRTNWKMQGTSVSLLPTKKYIWNDENVTESNSSGAFELTQEVNHVMVRQSETAGDINFGGFGDDFKAKTKMHFTVNANGVPTATFSDFTFSCM